jgi:hypothetical protein
MTHDPLCPNVKHPDGCLCCEIGAPCIYCELIAKVCEETFAAAVKRVEALPWTSETWLAHAERAAIIAAIKGDSDE